MIVTDQYAPMVGGVPAVTRALAAGLAGRGHAVPLLAPSPGARGRSGVDQGASVIYRGSVRWPWYDGMRLAGLTARTARRLIGAVTPDVAHIHSPVTLGIMARIGAGRLSVPVVYTNHYLPANARAAAHRRSPAFDTLFY